MRQPDAPWFSGRPVAVGVLLAFVFIPPAAAGLFRESDRSPMPPRAPVLTRPGTLVGMKETPQVRRGWPRKAIVNEASVETATRGAKGRPQFDPGIWAQVLKPSSPAGSRLDFCPEFTKPDSLVLRLMGTPQNRRLPSA